MPNAVPQRRESLASMMLHHHHVHHRDHHDDHLLVESLLEDGFMLAEEAPKAWSRIAQVATKPEQAQNKHRYLECLPKYNSRK
jgi:hypothetical protein